VNGVQISYDKVADALYIRVSSEKVHDSVETCPDVIVDYNDNNEVIGVEVLDFSMRGIDLNEIIKLNIDELIPAIVRCQ